MWAVCGQFSLYLCTRDCDRQPNERAAIISQQNKAERGVAWEEKGFVPFIPTLGLRARRGSIQVQHL
jgi:hypothetical protein